MHKISYKPFPVLVSLRLSIDHSSSVMLKFSSILRMKISNSAVSTMFVLSSKATENYLSLSAVSKTFPSMFSVMASILRTLVLRDNEIASSFDF